MAQTLQPVPATPACCAPVAQGYPTGPVAPAQQPAPTCCGQQCTMCVRRRTTITDMPARITPLMLLNPVHLTHIAIASVSVRGAVLP